MHLRQAIIRSYRIGTSEQKTLLARSANVSDTLIDALIRWSPGRDDLTLGQAECFSFFPLDSDTLAVSRSTAGGLESSGRHSDIASRHIFSHVAILNKQQFECYQNNIVLLINNLRSMGMLLLPTSVKSELPEMELPDASFFESPRFTEADDAKKAEETLRAIEIHQQVAIVGLMNPLKFLSFLISEVPNSRRSELSFSTGMNVDSDRPFTLQFFRESNPVLEKSFVSRGLRTLNYESRSTVAC